MMTRNNDLNRAALALIALVAVVGTVKAAEAQFVAPTCVPPNCNPSVIQNIPLAGTTQTAGINISGDAKLGATLQAGAAAPTLTLATQNLMYGNVNAASTNASLLLLQVGAVDRLRVTLAGQQQLPLGSVAGPSYSFVGDTNTGIYSAAADTVSMATGGAERIRTSSSGVQLMTGQIFVPLGSAAAPTHSFSGDSNTGLYSSAADTLNFSTGGVSRMTVSSTGTVVVANTLQVNGGIVGNISGTLSGDGSGLTSINATNITSGTLSDARLSTNVALLNGTQTFTGANTFSNASNSFTGTGAGLTYLNASSLASGTVPSDVVSGTYSNPVTLSNTGNSFTGSGAGLTSLNATNVSSGTLADARLSSNVALKNGANTFTNTNAFNGMTTFGTAALALTSLQNLIYGNVDTTSTGSLMLLQNESVDRFRIAANGDITAAGAYSGTNGAFSGTLTVGGQNVCRADGTNCPPTVNGSGTLNTVVKFTPNGSTVGNSSIYDDGTTVAIGTNTPPGFANTLMLQTAPAGVTNGLYMVANTVTAGQLMSLNTNSLTTGSGIFLTNTSPAWTSGSLIRAAHQATYTTTQTVSASILNVERNLTVNGVGQTLTTNGTTPVAVFQNTGAVTAGTYNDQADVVRIGENFVSKSNVASALNVTTAGAGFALRVNDDGTYADATPFVVNGSGDVGVGTAAPANKLDVSGNGRFTGTLAVTGIATLSNALTLGNLAAAPAVAAGRMYYDTVLLKFRCYENGAWKDCITTAPSGTGTAGKLTRWTSSTALGDAQALTEAYTGTSWKVGINSSPLNWILDVQSQDNNGGLALFTNNDVATSDAAIGVAAGASGKAQVILYGGGANVGFVTDNATGLIGIGHSDIPANTELQVNSSGLVSMRFGASVTGNMDVSGDMTVDSGSLFVNASNGYVGVGTVSPTTALNVIGGSDTPSIGPNGGSLKVQQAAGGKYILMDENEIQAYDVTNTPYFLHINNDGGTVVLTGGAAGSVAIGNTTPNNKLTVVGNADISGNLGINQTAPSYPLDVTAAAYPARFQNSSYGAYAWPAYGSHGIYAASTSNANSSNYGSLFYGWNGTSSNYGSYSYGYGGSNAYGVYATASGGSSNNYGVYARASGGALSYAVYATGGTYGVVGYGESTGGRFYDSDGTATTFIAGASWGVEIITGGAVKPGGGSWSAPSDVRTKTDISDFSDGLSVVRKLRPVNYTYNGLAQTPKGMKGIGFIAQEVEPVAPYLIQHVSKKLHPEDAKETDILLVDPSAVPFINMNAIKDLDIRIDGFEAKVAERADKSDSKIQELETKVKELEDRLQALESR